MSTAGLHGGVSTASRNDGVLGATGGSAPASVREKPEFLERLGVGFLKRKGAPRPGASRSTLNPQASGGGRAHVLTPAEHRALAKVELFTILRAALAGAFFGALGGLGEIVARRVLDFDEDVEYASVGNFLQFWGIVGIFVVVSTVGEILFLYWDGLRGVHRLAQIAGIELFPEEGGKPTEHAAVAAALARAALELPNPKASPFGINPMREASKLRLTIAMLVYKAKRGVTNILVKVVIRRMSTRAAARTVLPLLAVPVFALWNAYTVWVVMREARIRTIGPSAARELIGGIFAKLERDGTTLSDAGKLATLRAIGAAIVRQQDLHPNVLSLLQEVVRKVGEPGDSVIDDPRLFLDDLPKLPEGERAVVLDVLSAAVIMDGHFSKREEALYFSAQDACGAKRDVGPVRARVRALLSGEPLGTDG